MLEELVAGIMEREHLKIVALGDILVELWSTIPVRFSDLNSHETFNMEVREILGGSAGLFALFAKESFSQSYIIGKVGRDSLGDWAVAHMKEGEIETCVGYGSLETGKIIIIYDEEGNGHRLMIVNSPNANSELSISDIERHATVIENADVMYVSGYSISDSPRREATLYAMSIARKSGVLVAFDLVPHDVCRLYTFRGLRETLKDVSILISEMWTLRRFLNLGSSGEETTDEMASETVDRLRGIFDGYILRFGPNNYDKQVLVTSQGEKWTNTGYPHVPDVRGFGDRLSAEALYEILSG